MYETCIAACARAGDGVSALTLFEALQQRGLTTDLTIEKASTFLLAAEWTPYQSRGRLRRCQKIADSVLEGFAAAPRRKRVSL